MLKRGSQIAYIPLHVGECCEENVGHEDVEFGFVISVCEVRGIAFCQYWRQDEPGVLRTRANSEATPLGRLVEYKSVSDGVVERVVGRLGYFKSNGMIWEPGEIPMCEVCGEQAEYETPWSGVVLCSKPECIVEYCVFNGFYPIEYVEE